MLSAITRELLVKPKTALALCVSLILVLGFAGLGLQLDPSFSSLISSEGEFNTNARALENAFGVNSAFQIVFTLDDQSTLPNRPDRIDQETIQQSYDVLAELLENSQYVQSIGSLSLSNNGRQARFAVQVFEPNTPDGVITVKEEVEFFAANTPTPPGVNVQVTGFPVILDRVSTLLITDNLATILITALLVFLVLLWFFKNLRLALIGVLSPAASLAALAGIMVFLRIDITLTLAAVGVIVIGLGADYSIHLITTYTRMLREGKNPRRAILDSLDELELALTASFLTTAAGFLALVLGVSPSSQAQGQVLALAITLIFVVTMLMLPLLLFIFVKAPPRGGRESISFINGVFSYLARIQTYHPGKVLAFVGVITVFMLFGAAQIGFSTSNSNWIPDDDPVAVSFRENAYAFGEQDSLTIVVTSTRGDLRSIHTVRDLEVLETKLRGIPGVVSVNNPFSGVPASDTAIQERALSRAQSFNSDFTLTTLTVISEGTLIDESGSSAFLSEVQDIVRTTPIHNADTSLFGDIVRFSELGESLQQDAAITTVAGLILVFIVASLLYTSLAVGVVALAPIIIAVIWAVGLKGFFGIPFTSLSTGIISLVLGIGVDFSIHLVSSIQQKLKHTKNTQQAIDQALHTTGGAILLSSITTFFGFLALTFASLLGTQRLGWSLAFSILAVFVVTMLFVPAVMSIKQRRVKQRA